MFQFVGYNFFADGNALDSAPSVVANVTNSQLTNAIFDHFNLSRNTSMPFSTEKPTEWNFDTILDADFDGNLNGGNVDFLINQIQAVKIKRRIKGTFKWLTMKTIPINTVEDLSFAFIDRLNAYGTEYEYAFVPVLNDVEGDYIINSILSQFNGVFIGDMDSTYKFLYNVKYGNNARNQEVGLFKPLGRQYPVIVANGLLSYESGSVSADILNDDYEETGVFDPVATVAKKDILKDYLTNRKPKILKDWNGNIWLCIITDNVSVNYREGTGMGIPNVEFNWVEIGDPNTQMDLYVNGMLDTPE